MAPVRGEVVWEVGTALPEENWCRNWRRNESVQSAEYQISNTLTLRIFFYPAGVGDSDAPCFKFVRFNTPLTRRRIQLECQPLYDGERAAAVRLFLLDTHFERHRSELFTHFVRFPDLHALEIYHPLPTFSVRFIYTIYDPDPNELEPKPETGIIKTAIVIGLCVIGAWLGSKK